MENIEIKKERKQSSIEEDDTVDMKIYDLPDIDNVNNRVMCKLLMVSVVCVIFMAVEIVGGIIANSLAIMTDAAHLFADLSGLFNLTRFLYIHIFSLACKETINSLNVVWVQQSRSHWSFGECDSDLDFDSYFSG